MDMKYLDKRIKSEFKDAENYWEMYVECKSAGNNQEASIFQTMATQELGHAEMLLSILREQVKKYEAQEVKEKGKVEESVYRELFESYMRCMWEELEDSKEKMNKAR